mgnify:CR=1 FL=1
MRVMSYRKGADIGLAVARGDGWADLGAADLLAVLAGSSSDISGPPTLRAAIPTANPSSYIGSSTSIGTPVAIAVGIPLYIALGQAVFGF